MSVLQSALDRRPPIQEFYALVLVRAVPVRGFKTMVYWRMAHMSVSTLAALTACLKNKIGHLLCAKQGQSLPMLNSIWVWIKYFLFNHTAQLPSTINVTRPTLADKNLQVACATLSHDETNPQPLKVHSNLSHSRLGSNQLNSEPDQSKEPLEFDCGGFLCCFFSCFS